MSDLLSALIGLVVVIFCMFILSYGLPRLDLMLLIRSYNKTHRSKYRLNTDYKTYQNRIREFYVENFADPYPEEED